jgi:cytochrome c oxidase assembly factor CtaG
VDPYAWSWSPEALVLVPLLAAAYLLALRRYPASPWRIASFLTAMMLLLAVGVTPIHALGMHFLLTVHLLQNVVLAEWAPLLVVLGIPPALAARLTRPRALRALTHPAVALPLWLANYMVWHLWLYDTALESPNTSCTSSTRCISHRACAVVVRLPGRARLGPRRAGYVLRRSSWEARSGS